MADRCDLCGDPVEIVDGMLALIYTRRGVVRPSIWMGESSPPKPRLTMAERTECAGNNGGAHVIDEEGST